MVGHIRRVYQPEIRLEIVVSKGTLVSVLSLHFHTKKTDINNFTVTYTIHFSDEYPEILVCVLYKL